MVGVGDNQTMEGVCYVFNVVLNVALLCICACVLA